MDSTEIKKKHATLASQLRTKVEKFLTQAAEEDLPLLEMAMGRSPLVISKTREGEWIVRVTSYGLEISLQGRGVGVLKPTSGVNVPPLEWFQEGVVTRGYLPEAMEADLWQVYMSLIGYMFPELSE